MKRLLLIKLGTAKRLLASTIILMIVVVASPRFVSANNLIEEIEFERLKQLASVQGKYEIAPYSTDGCSGNLSRFWGLLAENLPDFQKQFGSLPLWENCCLAHDKIYWSGEAVDGFNKRRIADEELRQCVIETGNRLASELSQKYETSEKNVRESFTVTADLMYMAVRLGGQPCSLLPWRWGYGWPNCAFESIDLVSKTYSNIKSDETVTFFNTTGWFDSEVKLWRIPIHAWVFELEDSVVRAGIFASVLESGFDLPITPETEENFRERVNLMVADNERGKVLVIRLMGQEFTLPVSKENGHTTAMFDLTEEQAAAFSFKGQIRYFVVMPPGDNRKFEGVTRLISNRGVSVNSDIDDTIKITGVHDTRELLANTFLRDFSAAPGMPELYQELGRKGTTFHYVSSSPWQLYQPLMAFMDQYGFPWRSCSLKSVRFRDETLFNLFKPGTETKPPQIELLFERFPKRQFILIGDSGEQDPEIYGQIARKYPNQILRIWIRDVDNSSPGDQRYQNAFRDIKRSKWRLFDDPDELDIESIF